MEDELSEQRKKLWEQPKIGFELKEWNDDLEDVLDERNDSTETDFDKQSTFVVAVIEGVYVGAIRLTDSSKASPLKSWSASVEGFNTGVGVIELTKGFVRDSNRNLGIFQNMMLHTMYQVASNGFKFATTEVGSDSQVIPFLEKLGFK